MLTVMITGFLINSTNANELARLTSIEKYPEGATISGAMSDGTAATIFVTYYSKNTVRIRLSVEDYPSENFSLLYEGVEPISNIFKIEETATHFNLSTEVFKVSAQKTPARISFLTPEDEVVLMESSGAGMEILNDKPGTQFNLDDDDHFFGFGEKFGKLDKRGTQVECINRDAGDSYGDSTYINIPFFMNPKGYGIFFHTTWRTEYHLGDISPQWFSMAADGGVLDYFFIYGPSLKQILRQYVDLTGHMELPPKWALGLWHGTYTGGHKGMAGFGQEEFLDIARTFRKRNIPIDVMRIDSNWDDLVGADYIWHNTYPEPAQMIKEIKEMGYKMSLHDRPIPYGILRHYPLRRGWLVPPQLEYLDFSIPEAAEWWWHRHEVIIDMGLDAWKPDIGEEIPAEAKFANGMSGAEMRNLYARLYIETHYHGMRKYTGKRPVMFARSGYAGSQQYPLVWGGDQHYSRWDQIPTLIRAGQCIGLSGFPLWSHDIGGIGTQKGIIPTADVYVRWAQFGFFSGVPQTFGRPWREPWKYDKSAWYGTDVTKIFRSFDQLRYRLLPYVYSLVWEAHETGLPLMRAMVLEFQEDEQAWEHDLQYMFGPAFLVAPICQSGNERSVYLPAGTWYDFWTEQKYEGPVNLTIRPDMDQMPLYVRGGAIVPMGPVIQYTGEKPLDPLEFHIYPAGGSTEFRYYDDDGESYDYTDGGNSQIVMSSEDDPRQLLVHFGNPAGGYSNKETQVIQISVHQLQAKQVLLNKKRIRSKKNYTALIDSHQGWIYSKDENITIIRVPYSSLAGGLDLTLKK